MNKWTKTVLRTGTFLLSTAISISLLGWFSFWAWTHLDLVQRETIAATNTRWDIGLERWKLRTSRQVAADRDDSIDTSTEAVSFAHLP